MHKDNAIFCTGLQKQTLNLTKVFFVVIFCLLLSILFCTNNYKPPFNIGALIINICSL